MKGIQYETDEEDEDEENSESEEEEEISNIDYSKHSIKQKNAHLSKNVWIVKPGENSNRGCGIHVANTIQEISSLVRSYGAQHTCIIQKYIERPLLIHRRKFDFRVFGLMTAINGIHKGYYFEDGYLRTASTEYNLHNLHSRYVHLTNDAIQKRSDNYGKFESGNKISYQGF